MSLYNFANPSVPVSTLSVPAVTNFREDLANASLMLSTTFPFLRWVEVATAGPLDTATLDAAGEPPPAAAAEAPAPAASTVHIKTMVISLRCRKVGTSLPQTQTNLILVLDCGMPK